MCANYYTVLDTGGSTCNKNIYFRDSAFGMIVMIDLIFKMQLNETILFFCNGAFDS